MKVQTSMRIEEETLIQAKAILEKLGMNFSDAVNIFTKMIVQTKGLPFEVKLPNTETLQAMREADSGDTLPVNLEAMRQSMVR
jgi:DNA-damage-inducible protein J